MPETTTEADEHLYCLASISEEEIELLANGELIFTEYEDVDATFVICAQNRYDETKDGYESDHTEIIPISNEVAARIRDRQFGVFPTSRENVSLVVYHAESDEPTLEQITNPEYSVSE